MWFYIFSMEAVVSSVTVVMRPIVERSTRGEFGQKLCPISVPREGNEDRSDFLHMFAVFLRRPSLFIYRHPQDLHHSLQSALRTEAIQLVGVRPTLMVEQKLRVLPVASVGVDKVRRVNHRRIQSSVVFQNDDCAVVASGLSDLLDRLWLWACSLAVASVP